MESERCHILCFGNDLHGDDGYGIHVYRRLCQFRWPDSVHLFNAGIMGLDALNLLDSCDFAILVDALDNRGNPGALHVFEPDLNQPFFAEIAHQVDLPYLIRAMAVLIQPPPRILIIGVEVFTIRAFSTDISAPVKNSIDATINSIRRELIRDD